MDEARLFTLPVAEWRRRSGLLIPLDGLPPAFTSIRARYTADGARVPPHITLLTPFLAPPELDDAARAKIEEAVQGFSPFTITLRIIERFSPGVIYVSPHPAAEIVALGEALQARFPGLPLHDGAFAEFIPHVTLADEPGSVEAAAIEIEEQIAPLLPISLSVTKIALLQERRPPPARWSRVAEYDLGRRIR